MPLKDDVAKYINQGKEAVSGYVEAYKDKEKQRKEGKEHEEHEKASLEDQPQVINDKQPSTPSDTPAASTSAQTTDIAKTGDARPSSALGRYKDRLAIKLPTGQFDIGASSLVMITSPHKPDMMSVRPRPSCSGHYRECYSCTVEHKSKSR